MNYDLNNILAAEAVDAMLNVLAIIGIVSVGAFILIFIIDLILVVSTGKKGIFFKPRNSTNLSNNGSEAVNNTANEDIEYICDYCGASLDKDEKYCSTCGAKRHTKK